MAAIDSQEINTRVYNKSGADLFLGFLPPHGRTVKGSDPHVPATDFIDVPGDLRAQVALNPRSLAAMKALLVSTDIEIGFTPALILMDEKSSSPLAGQARRIKWDSGQADANGLLPLATSWDANP